MIIYIDPEYKCHTSPAEDRREFNISFFDDKCAEFIEGYRYLPEGETWTREDGIKFSGEMIACWKNETSLKLIQSKYENKVLSQHYEATLAEIENALEVNG